MTAKRLSSLLNQTVSNQVRVPSHQFNGEEAIELIKELDMSKDYPSSTNFKLIMSYYFIFKVTSLLKKEITHVHFTGCHRESIHYSLCIHKYMHNKYYVVHLKREVVRSHWTCKVIIDSMLIFDVWG